jgi:hypothetical protein
VSTTFDQEAQAYAWVHEHMSVEEVQALNQFLASNPGQRGIHWWDALSIMRDCDAHLDIIEPMAEAIKEAGGEWTTLHTFVTLTIIYASRPFATEWSTEQRVIVLQATIGNNGPTSTKPLVDDLAYVLACQAAGWLGILSEIDPIAMVTSDGFGVHPEVQRVLARYRAQT